ncbi:DUF4389 domain-containing protein [Nonomuraea pusilla]|uniref:DUF4389 domain-containing protein n=1 Tax=Nonomuraea pusilla TaxID=46177 RepID=UPI0033198972
MSTYPVRVEARLEEPLNRGLWIVKWVLAIPHYVVLAFLWIAMAVLTVVAFFAILFTGRYPRALFDFNLGVLRWTWRVAFYSYGALGTDRYPPFTLGPAPGYPATLEIDYPERLSRGLVLVKWWLLAVPHYLVVGLFTSGSILSWTGALPDRGGVLYTLDWGGLIGLLVLVAALSLLFTGRYPHGVLDFVVGMNRWSLRVAAYALLMTDAYPPFRLEQGERELPRMEPPPAPHPRVRHRAGSVVAVAAGAVLVFCGLGAAAAGTGGTFVSMARGDDGFLSSGAERVSTSAYALTLEPGAVTGNGVDLMGDAVGTVRLTATGAGAPAFVGIAPKADVERYLNGVSHDRITRLSFPAPGSSSGPADVGYERHAGGAPSGLPAAQRFWSASGTGAVTWNLRPGEWAVVVMNADGSAGVTTDLRVAATLPGLRGLTAGLLVAAGLLLVGGGALITAGVRMANAPAGAGSGADQSAWPAREK